MIFDALAPRVDDRARYEEAITRVQMSDRLECKYKSGNVAQHSVNLNVTKAELTRMGLRSRTENATAHLKVPGKSVCGRAPGHAVSHLRSEPAKKVPRKI